MKTLALQRNHSRTTREAAPAWLLNGDHLSVPEFERRYEAMQRQSDLRAELIEGIVFISPSIPDVHGKAHSLLNQFLGQYAFSTPNVACAVSVSLRLDGKNEFLPDLTLWVDKDSLAQCKPGKDGILEGRPELVAEIALNDCGFDWNEKKEVYQRIGIPEYIIWEPNPEYPRLHWFVLEDGEYVGLEACRRLRSIVFCSRIFPGLWLEFASLVVGQGADKRVFRTFQKGLKSAEHKAFVKKLASP